MAMEECLRIDISPRYFLRAINSLSSDLEKGISDYVNQAKQEGEQVTRSRFVDYVNQMAQDPKYQRVFMAFRDHLIRNSYMKIDGNGQPVTEDGSGTTLEDMREKLRRKTSEVKVKSLEKLI